MTTAVQQAYVGVEIPLKNGDVFRCRALPLRTAVKFLTLCEAWEKQQRSIEETLGVIVQELPAAIDVTEEQLQALGLSLGDVYGMLCDHFFPACRYQPAKPSAPLTKTPAPPAAPSQPTSAPASPA